jgi:hypothetical protein
MKIIQVATLIAAFAAPTAGLCQDLELWGTAGGRDVLIDPSLGNGCLIQAEYQDGSLVRIGFDRTEGTGYVTAFNEDWGDVEEGVIYPITFALDGAEYEGEAKGIYLDGVPGADISFTNADFLFDLAKKYTMTLYHDGDEVMSIDLEGSYIGLEAVIQCQEELG